MRRFLFAAVAGLPLVLGAVAANAGSIQESFGGSMYQPQSPLPNAAGNARGGFAAGNFVEGRSAYVDPWTAQAPQTLDDRSTDAPLTGRDYHQGDNF